MALKDLEKFENQVGGGMRSVPGRDARDDGIARPPLRHGRTPATPAPEFPKSSPTRPSK